MSSLPRLPGADAAALAPAPRAAAVPGALAALSLCMLLPALGTSSANVALPTLAEGFGASFDRVRWVVLAYLLTTTALVVSAGRLGDLIGRRRLLLGGLALFTLASLGCGLAPTLGGLIAARAAQGAGAAVLMALTLAFVGATLPKAQTGRAMGLLGATSAVGTALGPALGGVLIAGLGWRSLFLVNLPLGVAALWLVRRCLPPDGPAPRAQGQRFDVAGTLVLAATLAAYALAMTAGRGRSPLLPGALLAAAAGGLGLFAWVESRAVAPLIRLARLRDPVLGPGLATSALVATVVMATLVVGPFYLARALGLAPAGVGLAMSVGPLVAALAGVPAGRLVEREGAARMTLAGLAAMALGCLALALAPAAWGVAGYVAPLAVLTAGYALFQAANNTGVMQDAGAEQRGVVSGLLNLARNLGLITGVGVMGTVFSLAVGTGDMAAAEAGNVVSGMRVVFCVGAGVVAVAIAVAARNSDRARLAP